MNATVFEIGLVAIFILAGCVISVFMGYVLYIKKMNGWSFFESDDDY